MSAQVPSTMLEQVAQTLGALPDRKQLHAIPIRYRRFMIGETPALLLNDGRANRERSAAESAILLLLSGIACLLVELTVVALLSAMFGACVRADSDDFDDRESARMQASPVNTQSWLLVLSASTCCFLGVFYHSYYTRNWRNVVVVTSAFYCIVALHMARTSGIPTYRCEAWLQKSAGNVWTLAQCLPAVMVLMSVLQTLIQNN
ncbi:MAG: hypothetical protein MHM6MM_005770 [Cercozoa sp. M6MM]